MKALPAICLALALAACATPSDQCMTDEEIREYREKTGTKLNDEALRAACRAQQSSLPHHLGHHVNAMDEPGAEDTDSIGSQDPLALLKSGVYIAAQLPWHIIF